MITSMITPMIRPMITSMIRALGLSRYFISLDPVANSYYEISSPIDLTGDFDITAEFSSTATTSDNLVLGSSATSNTVINLRTTSSLRVRDNTGAAIDSANGVWPSGKLNTLKVTRISNNLIALINGVEVINGTLSGNFTFDLIGNYQPGVFFDGIISNVIINDITGGEVTTFRLNQATANYELSAENVFGSEEVANGDFSDGTTGWTANSSTLSVASSEMEVMSDGGAGSGARQVITTVVGQLYKIEFTLRRGTTPNGNQVRIGTSAGASNRYFSGNMTSSTSMVGFFTATGTTTYYAMGYGETGSGQTSYWSGVTIRSVTNAVIYNNIAGVDRELFKLSNDQTQWDNVSPSPQELPATIEIA